MGPAAFGCRLCTARRTGQAVRAVRYVPRWRRVCLRHGRWLLDADADQPREHLDLRGVAEGAAAQRRWLSVARRAVHRLRITQLLDESREQMAQLRGVQSGTTAEVARALLEHLSHSAELIDRAVLHAAATAVAAGVALQDVARWSRLPAEELAEVLAEGQVDG